MPDECEISIYSINGSLVRKFKKADPNKTSVDWDLKNTSGIPVASGMYVIHVKSDAGERIVKFMGMMRPIDLDNF